MKKRLGKVAKVTLTQVREIRRRYEEGETQAELGRVFGLSTIQVGRIVRRECWQDALTPEEQRLGPEESAQSVWRQIQNGMLEVEREREREEETPPRPDRWDEGLTEEEVKRAQTSINLGMSEWVARETILNARNINKGE